MYQNDRNNYVKLWRSILNNGFLMSDNNAYNVFTKLLMCVDRRTGSFTTGRYALAELCNMKPSTVRDVLKRLEREKMIIVEPDYSKSKIFICKWSDYQSSPVTSPSPARLEPVSTTTLNKKKKEKKNIDTNVSIAISEKPVDDMFKLWNSMASKQLKPTAASKKACSKLLKDYGEEAVTTAIHGAIFYQQKEFRPQVLSFTSMEAKWDNLNHWMDKDKNKANLKVAYIS